MGTGLRGSLGSTLAVASPDLSQDSTMLGLLASSPGGLSPCFPDEDIEPPCVQDLNSGLLGFKY
jgi:hypothetical protein